MVEHYTEAELRQLKKLFKQYHLLTEIAYQLGRSEGSVAQQVFKLGLKRDNRIVRLVGMRGSGVLRYGDTPEKIRAGIARHKAKVRKQSIQNERILRRAAIHELKKMLKDGIDRNHAIKSAYFAGALQEDIGKVVGLSKQGVSLIVKPPKKEQGK